MLRRPPLAFRALPPSVG